MNAAQHLHRLSAMGQYGRPSYLQLGFLFNYCFTPLAEVYEPIMLSLGVVSGMGRGMGLLDWVYVPQGERIWGFFFPNGLNGVFFEQKCI